MKTLNDLEYRVRKLENVIRIVDNYLHNKKIL